MGLAGIKLPSDPHLRRWMIFVDGENFAIEAQKLADKKGQPLREGPCFMRDVFVWMPDVPARKPPKPSSEFLQETALRAYYYTSVQGDDEKLQEVKEAIQSLGFTPCVFKKPKGVRAKRVDITLTLDMVGHAYSNNYDVAVLFAGDGDYVPLVEHVKHLGKGVVVYFLAESPALNPDLRHAADTFVVFDDNFFHSWKGLSKK